MQFYAIFQKKEKRNAVNLKRRSVVFLKYLFAFCEVFVCIRISSCMHLNCICIGLVSEGLTAGNAFEVL